MSYLRHVVECLTPYVPLVQIISGTVTALAASVAAATYVLNRKWYKMQATFTFFPKPLELEAIENKMDSIIRFIARAEKPLTAEEVDLLFFQSTTGDRDEKAIKVCEKLMSLGRDMSAEMGALKKDASAREANDKATIDKFYHDMRECGRLLKTYLNAIERYCAAIQVGIADDKTARMIFGPKFIIIRDKVDPFVRAFRQGYSGQAQPQPQAKGRRAVFLQFDHVVENWRIAIPKDEDAAGRFLDRVAKRPPQTVHTDQPDPPPLHQDESGSEHQERDLGP